MSGFSLAEAKVLTFEALHNRIRQAGLSGQPPLVYALYAHDDRALGLDAHQHVARDYIAWFRALGIHAVSGQTPLPGHSPARDGAASDNLVRQLGLLPPTQGRRSVDYVLLFYSPVLAHYMHEQRAQAAAASASGSRGGAKSYFDAVAEACAKHRNGPPKACEDAIRRLQQTYSDAMGPAFHPVLTELALLRVRNKAMREPCTMPIILGDHPEKWPGTYQYKAGHFELTETTIWAAFQPENRHRNFFKILQRIEAVLRTNWLLLNNCLDCFKQTVAAYSPGMTAVNFRRRLDANIVALNQEMNENRRILNKNYTPPSHTQSMVCCVRSMLDANADDLAALTRVSGHRLPHGLDDIRMEIDTGTARAGERVTVHSLFATRKVADRVFRPYRIFVSGKPGVGKSALCRRIMREYLLNEWLRSMFALVVVIPARMLTADLSDVLYAQYFRSAGNGHAIADFVQDRILGVRDDDKQPDILVILDGLDETRAWDARKRSLLDRLLRLPALLVTSRTADDAKRIPFDLRLNAVGLSTESISRFLSSRAIVPPHTANSIQGLISTNAAVRDIARLPFFLDIICASWCSGNAAGHEMQPNMTALYLDIVQSLWSKDIPRLHKNDHGKPVTKELIRSLQYTSQLDRFVEPEVLTMEQLAITMTEQNQVAFSPGDVAAVIRRIESDGHRLPLSLEHNLFMLSIFHQITPAQYCFVHPTFQAFFAAKHVTRNPSRTRMYRKGHKGHARFDMLWQFVPGLLSDQAQSSSVLAVSQQEPRQLNDPPQVDLAKIGLAIRPRR